MIDGGANGAIAFFVGAMIGIAVSLFLLSLEMKLFSPTTAVGKQALLAIMPQLLAVLLPTLAVLTAFVALVIITDDDEHTNLKCLASGFGTGLGLAGIYGGAVTKTIYSGITNSIFGFASGLYGASSCF